MFNVNFSGSEQSGNQEEENQSQVKVSEPKKCNDVKYWCRLIYFYQFTSHISVMCKSE